MTRFDFVFALAALTLFSCKAAEPAATNAVARIAIVAVGDVPAKLAAHARDWAEQNLAISIDLLPAQKLGGKSLDDIAAQAIKAGGTNRAHIVAIALPPEGINSHGMRTVDKRAAVVNLRPMQEDRPDAQVLERRIERQTLRAIALMLDVETCVNPQCALSRYQSLMDLDRTGRNLCPPCLQRVQKNAAAEHLDMNKNSPFYIER